MPSKKDIDYLKNEFPKIRNLWLEKVSRTFTLSIKILPNDLQSYVGHAYLICRLLDSIEDAEDISLQEKHKALNLSIEILTKKKVSVQEKDYFITFSKLQKFPKYEQKLLCSVDILIHNLLIFPVEIATSITNWAIEMARGMIKYSFSKQENPIPFFHSENLEEYTYYVAGTVGEMLSEMFRYKTKIKPNLQQAMEKNSIAFGKALQYVNIIKDSRSDYKEGRCFIPDDILKGCNLSKSDFFTGADKQKIKRVYELLIKKAWNYLNSAHDYIEAIPSRYWRIRLFCIWPVILAAKTLSKLENDIESFIDDSLKFKISRKEVKKSILCSYPAGFSNLYLKLLLKRNKWRFYD